MEVLVLAPHYLPGFNGGGPIRSIANLVARLGDEIRFHIITRDRDLGDSSPYQNVLRKTWQRVGKADVAYMPPSFSSLTWMARALREKRPDVLYLNSFFDWRYCAVPLLLMRAGLMPMTPIVIAGRGQFGAGALALKSRKKMAYVTAMQQVLRHLPIHWHATCQSESREIRRLFGSKTVVSVAPNVCVLEDHLLGPRKPKQPGEMSLVFLSRISKKKNLLSAIGMLADVSGRVSLDVWGPIEDPAYWRQCQESASRLPANAQVVYRGILSPVDVGVTLSQYDALLLPTRHENFGHVIAEAAVAGCPIVISDQTPWRGLRQLGVGWDIPLDDDEQFQAALSSLSAMDEAVHQRMRREARHFARRTILCPATVELNRQLFQNALNETKGEGRHAARRWAA